MSGLVHSPPAHTQPGAAKTVADVLTSAADLIAKPGAWTQGAWARTATGRAASPFADNATCFCLRGALVRVKGVKLCDGLDGEREALGFSTDSALARWNDKEPRTQAEVVAALRAAAEKARTASSVGTEPLSGGVHP